MVNWKKAVVIGSMTAGALLLIKGKRPAGAALTTVGLVVLATEYPEHFEHIWENAPEYISRGAQIFSAVQRVAERFADEAQRGGITGALREIGVHYGG
jgi:hypothetical protein